MYNPISIVNMHHGLNLNGSSPDRGIQFNQLGSTPPKHIQDPILRPQRNTTPNTDNSSTIPFLDSTAADSRRRQSHGSHASRKCSGCDSLEHRLSLVEEELRANAGRFDEFQQDIIGHLNRLSHDFHSLSNGWRNQNSSRSSDTVSMDSARPLVTPSVRQIDFETRNYGYSNKTSTCDDPQQVITEACAQLECLIADARSRLNP